MRRNRIVLGTIAAIVALAWLVPGVGATPRGGALHVTKECAEYTGQAGSFCTFTSSNLRAIPPGARIVYADAAGATSLDTDVAIPARPGSVAHGHCTLDFLALPGRCTFSGGTGMFIHFRAVATVSVDATGLWHWDGWYAFSPKG